MTEKATEDVPQLLEALYRSDSSRVLATLIRLLGDFDRAEDALHDAFRAALEQWAARGGPENPRAWLIPAGRFKAIDRLRRSHHETSLDAIQDPADIDTKEVEEREPDGV